MMGADPTEASKRPAISQEATKDTGTTGVESIADQVSEEDKKALIDLIIKITSGWEFKRRGIVLTILENKEMLKGNHYIGFYPDSMEVFDAMDEFENFTGSNGKTGEDRSLHRYVSNFYQMLHLARQAVLTADVPKVQFMPADGDSEEDRQTAKAASRVEDIIERANKVRSMLRQEVMSLNTAGSYFKYCRYVVDSDRTGTHKETSWAMQAAEVLPARYVCFHCGMATPEDGLIDSKAMACPNCRAPFGPENYFENHVENVPVAAGKEDVPNGMVLEGVYDGMHVNADPDAQSLIETSLLDLAEEVSLGWLRQTFKDSWGKVGEGETSAASNELMERQYRSMLTTPTNYSAWRNYSSQDKPTYHRTWLQPMAFNELPSKAQADKFIKLFPKGVMLAWVGNRVLQLRQAKLTDEWSWCGTMTGFGLFPGPAMNPAVSVQKRINNLYNLIDEYFDRLACGILLANEGIIDTKAMNGKSLLPGVLNGITFKRSVPPNIGMESAIFQVKTEIEAAIFTHVEMLKHDMELLVGSPPQLYGGQGDPHIETKGGQQQQLSTAMGKLGLDWNYIREEHAEAAENAVRCAAKNMTEDWFDVVTDENQGFRNEYVHLDEMKGSVRAVPEADQGFPMTYAEQKAWWEDVIQNGNNQLVQWLMQEPKNIDTAVRFIGVPGLIAPGGAMRAKMLYVIDQLIHSGPQPAGVNPMTQEPIMLPSILPNKYLDDLPASAKLVESWTQEHWDKVKDDQNAVANLVAYYKLCLQYAKEKAAEQQLSPPPGAGPQAPPQIPTAAPTMA